MRVPEIYRLRKGCAASATVATLAAETCTRADGDPFGRSAEDIGCVEAVPMTLPGWGDPKIPQGSGGQRTASSMSDSTAENTLACMHAERRLRRSLGH